MSDFDFFRHCWMTLKRSKPRMRKFMDEIEFTVEGAGIVKDKTKPTKEKQERTEDDKPQPIIV